MVDSYFQSRGKTTKIRQTLHRKGRTEIQTQNLLTVLEMCSLHPSHCSAFYFLAFQLGSSPWMDLNYIKWLPRSTFTLGYVKAEAFTCFILHLYSSWYSLQIPTSTYAKKKITCASIFQPPQKSPFIPNDTFNITHLHCCNLKHSAHSIHLRKDFQHSKNSYIPNHMSIFQIFHPQFPPQLF